MTDTAKIELPPIERYDFEDDCAGACGCSMRRTPIGDYVLYEDAHAQLLFALERISEMEQQLKNKVSLDGFLEVTGEALRLKDRAEKAEQQQVKLKELLREAAHEFNQFGYCETLQGEIKAAVTGE